MNERYVCERCSENLMSGNISKAVVYYNKRNRFGTIDLKQYSENLRNLVSDSGFSLTEIVRANPILTYSWLKKFQKGATQNPAIWALDHLVLALNKLGVRT